MRAYIVLALCIIAAPIKADESAGAALDAFYGTCVAQGPNYERTVAAAKLFSWEPAPPDAITLLGPMEKPEAFQMWLISGSGYPKKTLLGITKSHSGSTPVQTCTMAMADVDGYRFDEIFSQKLKLEKLADTDDGIQTTKIYRGEIGTRDQIIMLTMPTSRAKDSSFGLMITASSLAAEKGLFPIPQR